MSKFFDDNLITEKDRNFGLISYKSWVIVKH